MATSRDSIGSIMHEFVESFPIDVDARQSISDLGKVLFTESQKPTEPEPVKKPFQMPKEIKGIPRQKQQDVTGITASGRVALPQGSVRKLLQTQGKATPMRWTPEEDDALRKAVEAHGERNWKSIAEVVPGRNHTQCLQRWTKVLAPGLIKGHWRPDEDDILRQLVAEGRKNWGQVATRIPGRTSKQCRERWYNHLDPNIVRGEYTAEEDQIILEAQQRIGNRWSAIAAMLPGRTEDAVKIRWKSLCRTKSGRGRRSQPEKDLNGTISPITVTPVPNDPKSKQQYDMPKVADNNMSFQRSMMSELQSPMMHHNPTGNMHQMQQPMHHPSPVYQGNDVYQSGYTSPHHYGQAYNPAEQFMQKMNYDTYSSNAPSYGNYTPMNYNPRNNSYPPQGYPSNDGSYPQASPHNYSSPMVPNPAASFLQQMQSSPRTLVNDYKPSPPMRQNSGNSNFVQQSSANNSVAANFAQQSSANNSVAANFPQQSAANNSVAANFAQQSSANNSVAANFAQQASGNNSVAANFAQSQGNGTNSYSQPSGGIAASFVQSLGSQTPLSSSSGGTPSSKPPPVNIAANFAQQFASKSPSDSTPTFMKQGNIAASFAASQPNVAAAFVQQQNEEDSQNKRPRLPLSMDAARASAARRMRQNENHADFVNNPNEAPPAGSEINRLSVSDINLSELGPIEEMWRVSSDMNRLSL